MTWVDSCRANARDAPRAVCVPWRGLTLLSSRVLSFLILLRADLAAARHDRRWLTFEARADGNEERATRLEESLFTWYARRIQKAADQSRNSKAARLRAALEHCRERASTTSAQPLSLASGRS